MEIAYGNHRLVPFDYFSTSNRQKGLITSDEDGIDILPLNRFADHV